MKNLSQYVLLVLVLMLSALGSGNAADIPGMVIQVNDAVRPPPTQGAYGYATTNGQLTSFTRDGSAKMNLGNATINQGNSRVFTVDVKITWGQFASYSGGVKNPVSITIPKGTIVPMGTLFMNIPSTVRGQPTYSAN